MPVVLTWRGPLKSGVIRYQTVAESRLFVQEWTGSEVFDVAKPVSERCRNEAEGIAIAPVISSLSAPEARPA